MREIKFRALNWNEIMIYGNLITNERGKKFVVANDYFCIDGHHLSCDSDYPIWCKEETIGQYTGLKDCNGVEIYEGDIVKVHIEIEENILDKYEEVIGVVDFGNSLKVSKIVAQYPCSFCLISKEFYKEQTLLFNDRFYKYEILGNIYENPELLEVE